MLIGSPSGESLSNEQPSARYDRHPWNVATWLQFYQIKLSKKYTLMEKNFTTTPITISFMDNLNFIHLVLKTPFISTHSRTRWVSSSSLSVSYSCQFTRSKREMKLIIHGITFFFGPFVSVIHGPYFIFIANIIPFIYTVIIMEFCQTAAL